MYTVDRHEFLIDYIFYYWYFIIECKFNDIDFSRVINATHPGKGEQAYRLMDDGLDKAYGAIQTRDLKDFNDLWVAATGKKFSGKFLSEINWTKLATMGGASAVLTGGIPVASFIPLLKLHKSYNNQIQKKVPLWYFLIILKLREELYSLLYIHFYKK